MAARSTRHGRRGRRTLFSRRTAITLARCVCSLLYHINLAHPAQLDLTTGDTPRAHRLKEKYDLLTSAGRTDLKWLSSGVDIKAVSPTLSSAKIDSWRGLYTSDGGWVAARDALNSVGRELQRLGVKSAFGTSGTFKELIIDGGRCVGVRAVDGAEWRADLVVLAAGAWSPCLVDLEEQCTSKVSVVGTISGFKAKATGMGLCAHPTDAGRVCAFPGHAHNVQ